MRDIWTFHSAGTLLFGREAVGEVGRYARKFGFRRVFVLTDPILARLPALELTVKSLHAADVQTEVFTEGEPEPSVGMMRRAIAVAKMYAPDAVLGLGGGSNMDAAKLTAVVLSHGGDPTDYGGDERIPGPILPVICIPTTAGTGSEVSGAAVYGDPEKQIKIGVLSNWLRPRLAIVDPLLTVSCPRKVTADSGIDALTHAVEAFTAVDNAVFPLPPGEKTIYQGKHPFGDLTAEKCIELVGRYLKRAVDNPNDLEARDGMALAATLGGLAFSNVGVALVHAMEYPVGGAVHCSHGAGNGLLLPHVMAYNLAERPREFARIALLLGEPPQSATPERAVERVHELREAIGVPGRLRDLGVKEEQLPRFAEKAFAVKRLMRVNPRVPTLDGILGVYRSAF